MRFRFFIVPAQGPEAAQDTVNNFCAQHRVVTVDRQFVALGAESYWALCLTYVEGAGPLANPAGARRERIDYKAVLDEQDFARYATLRNLRKALAEEDGVPAYALFTNEQLAEMVTRRASSLAALGEIEGVGKARLEKYGQRFLDALRAPLPPEPQKDSDEAPPHRVD